MIEILQRPDERLRSVKYPGLQQVPSYELHEGDTLVTCAGFEDRAFEYLRRAVERDSRGFQITAIDYLPKERANRISEVTDLAVRSRAKLVWITYDRENPSDPTLAVAEQPGRLLIDTSGMSRLLIVQLVCALVRSARFTGTEVIYTEAAEYPPTKEEVERTFAKTGELFSLINFISSGVFGIIVPPELSTVAMYGQPIRLITFPSFNPAQLAALCSEINASSYTIIHGRPHSDDNGWRKEAISRINSITSLREVEEVVTSTFDYRETVTALLDIYQRHGDRQKLIVSPTGSKMQALAVGLVSGFLHDIQIVYPAPRSFPSPDNYTKGVRQIYSLNLSFLGVPAIT